MSTLMSELEADINNLRDPHHKVIAEMLISSVKNGHVQVSLLEHVVDELLLSENEYII